MVYSCFAPSTAVLILTYGSVYSCSSRCFEDLANNGYATITINDQFLCTCSSVFDRALHYVRNVCLGFVSSIFEIAVYPREYNYHRLWVEHLS